MIDAPTQSTDPNKTVDSTAAYPKTSQEPDLIRVSLLGGFLIEPPNRVVELPSRKAQAILAYLMLIPSQKATRESIAGLLWSSATEDLARASLRQSLRRLKQYFDTIGIVGIEVTRNEIRLNSKMFETDLWSILQNDADAPVHPILLQRADISASLLLGFDDLDEAFNSWVLTQRQSLHDRLVASLELRLAQKTGQSGRDSAQTIKHAALALSNLDPTHEGACRELMLLHVRAGDIGSALKRYNRLWSLLEDDYDMEPSDETKALVALIKSGADEDGAETDTKSSKSDPAGMPRLIVESFSYAGVPEPLRFMARAFRHQFMSSLLKFRDWLVIDGERDDRHRVMLPTYPIFKISGDTFFKDTILYVVVSVRDSTNDTILWSEENPASLDTWPRTLRQLVQKLAIAVNTHIASNRQAAKRQETSQNTPVYHRWMHGNRLVQLWTPTGWAEAEDIFLSVCKDQPEFAPGYSSRSLCASLKRFVFPGFRDEAGLSHASLEQAKRSIELGPRDAKSYQAAGWAHILVGEFERAALFFGIAETLNENDIGVVVSSALGLAYCGETEESLRRLDYLQDADFVYQSLHWSIEAACRFICRDYSGTIWAAAKANEGAFYPQAWSAMAFAQLGNNRAAEREARQFLSTARENWTGAQPPLPGDISRWFLSAQPFRNPADYFHMKHCMERAGLTTR